MKAFTLSTLALLLGACPLLAQSTTVDVEVTLATPGASCAFTVSNDLEFGTVQKPTTGTGTVTIAATTGVRTSNGAVVSGTSTVGQVRLVGSHTADYTVSRTFPTSLDNGSESLTFTGSWAESTSASSGYTAITTSSYTGTAGGRRHVVLTVLSVWRLRRGHRVVEFRWRTTRAPSRQALRATNACRAVMGAATWVSGASGTRAVTGASGCPS